MRLHRLFVFAALVLAAAAPASAGSDPVADYLAWRGEGLAAIHALTLDGDVDASGLHGTDKQSATPARLRDEFDFSVLKGVTVISEAGAWETTMSGQVRTLSLDAKITAARRLDLLFATPLRAGRGKTLPDETKDDVSYRVVHVDYGDGDAHDYFIASDGALPFVRITQDTDVSWMALSDWRTVDGVKFAFKESLTYEEAMRNATIAWRSIAARASTDDAAFARPAAGRQVVSFPSGDAPAIPIKLFRDSYIVLPITVNGVATNALLDSGAEATALDATFAETAGIAATGALPASGAGGYQTAGIASGVTIETAGATLRDITPAIIDLSALSAAFGMPINAIVGQELFNEAVVEVDYAGLAVRFHDAATFAPREGTTVALVPHHGGLRQIEASVEGHPPGLFDFDTGNGGYTAISGYAADDWKLLDGRPASDVLTGGVGGQSVTTVVTASELAFAGVTLTNVPVTIGGASGGSHDTKRLAGNLGAAVFKRFRLWIDFAHDRLTLLPNPERIALPFDRDRCGLGFGFTKEGLAISHVAKASPAEAAGVTVGTIVRGINGSAVDRVSWPERLRGACRAPAGGNAVLSFDNGKTVTLPLRDYF